MSDHTTRTFVAYCRVSTARQGRSGLGLEAQEAAIRGFARPEQLRGPLFVEVESGRNIARPKLAEALAHCERIGATLLIAKLDRLARNVLFISQLMEARTDFVAVDMPTVDRLTIHILAAVAEAEARAISTRTKSALAAAKARGKVLGGIRPGQRVPTAEEQRAGATKSTETKRRAANQAAYRVLPRVTELKTGGAGLAEVARALQAEGTLTPRGGAWTATAVRRVLARTVGG